MTSFLGRFKQNHLTWLIPVLILLTALVLRLYRIAEYATFLGDEGRDALALKSIIVDHKLRLIGPVTSIGNMYLGPLYYYLITPAMFISGLSPVGPAIMVALLGVAAVYQVWLLGKTFFNPAAAIIAALLYAVSPVVIVYSRSSWNPNVMPFFALLIIWCLWKIWQKQEFSWLPIIGIAFSFAMQSHYLGLLLAPLILFFWLVVFVRLRRRKKPISRFICLSLLAILLFLILTIAPLVWFDLRHNFINFNAFKQFFTVRQETINLKTYKAIPKLWIIYRDWVTSLLAAKNNYWGQIIAIGIAAGLLIKIVGSLIKNGVRKFSSANPALVLILAWIGFGLLGLGSYKQHIYDHYFGFIFPAVFLIAGWILAELGKRNLFSKLIALAIFILLLYLNISNSPLKYPPNRQMQKTQQVAEFIIEKSADRPFNLALIAKNNYDDAYEFYLDYLGKPPVEINALNTKDTITDQLFVVCEDRPCEPINHPKAEVANFGWAKIDERWEVNGTEIYRLLHNRPEQ